MLSPLCSAISAMHVIVSYDIETKSPTGRRRLYRVARACLNYGQRVQYSVFECVVSSTDWTRLRHALLDVIDEEFDSLRFYYLPNDAVKKTEHFGVRAPLDFGGTLVM